MKDDGVRLGVIEFGKLLVESGDLDPLYIALWNSGMENSQLKRWLVCYWCYYHAGLSCLVSEAEGKSFWSFMRRIATAGTQYPRGTERRHFRGKLAMESVRRLGSEYPSPETLVDWLGEGGPTALGVTKRVLSLYGFGEWIKWKVPDMLDRLDLAPIRFAEGDLALMFSTSKQGAYETCKACGIEAVDELRAAHRYLKRKLGKLKAPPRYERRINVQETETIFCKWKSHLGGHYPIGKDCLELREGVEQFGECQTARSVLSALPESSLTGSEHA
jgi:hypothetical protein